MPMDQSKLDAATLAALMIRMEKYRLPRALRLLERVDKGEPLSDVDIAFLNRVHGDSKSIYTLVKRNPKSHKLVTQLMNLYTEIINKGIENEKAQ